MIATIPHGQAAQALVYVPQAAPTARAGTESLAQLGLASAAVHLALAAPDTGRTTAGAQIVNAVGPIRQFVDPAAQARDDRRYLVVMTVEHGKTGRPVQVQQPEVTRSSMDR